MQALSAQPSQPLVPKQATSPAPQGQARQAMPQDALAWRDRPALQRIGQAGAVAGAGFTAATALGLTFGALGRSHILWGAGLAAAGWGLAFGAAALEALKEAAAKSVAAWAKP